MHIPGHIEKELLLMLSQGDEIAFTKLFYAYKNKLYSFILQLTGSAAMAEDVVQETFLKVWRNRAAFSALENFNAYLFKIAQNDAINGLRRQSRGYLIMSAIEREKTDSNDIEDILTGKEMKAVLQQAVDRLPPQQRRVFELSRNEGLKYEEIANQLNISVSTVRNHMVQALKTIREFITSSYPFGIIYCALLFH